MTRLHTTFLTALGSVALLVAAGAAQAQAPAGVTAAVNPQATGTPPAELPHVLDIGSNVVQNEHLSTGPEGQAQFLFRDGSTLTLGPGSDLTIDNFVYDPDADTAKLAMTAASGAFRFVGGAASKTAPVVLNTPTATIGIRGGINYTTVGGNGDTETSQAYGTDTIATSKSTGEQRVLTKNGFTMIVKSGESITTAKIDLAKLNAMLASFQGRPGATGGATSTPNQNSQQARNVAITNSSQPPTIYASSSVPSTNLLGSVTSYTNQLVSQSAQVIANGTPTTGLATSAVALSTNTGLSGVFADQFNGSDYTIDPTSQIVGRNGSWAQINDSAGEQWTVGTAQLVQVSGDQDIQIGRLTNGSVTIETYYSSLGGYGSCTSNSCPRTYGPNQGFNYVLAIPTLQMPTSGTFTFGLWAATSPTFGDGRTAPGTFSGSLSVVFGSSAQIRLSASVQMPGDVTYTILPTTPISAFGALFNGSTSVSIPGGSSGACPTASNCLAEIRGIFAGVNANKVGITYVIGSNVGGCCAGSASIIVGAALFRH